MKRMAKELTQQKKMSGISPGGKRMTGISGMGGGGMGRSDSSIDPTPVEPSKPSYTAP